MEFIQTSDNPCPPGGVVAAVRAVDGKVLRVARWHPAGRPVGTVLICTGRAEFIEKYFEVVGELLQRQLVVVVFDWRGQGLSGRDLDNSRKGHIDDFSLYGRDLDALHEQVLAPFCPEPWFALGHSMGGAILIEQARAGRSPFERIVVTAPMLDLHGLRMPRFTRALASVLDFAGFGGSFIPGGGSTTILTRPFEDNALTSDPKRYARSANIVAAVGQVAIGDPTIGWVDAAFEMMQRFADPEYPRRTLTPILVVCAGSDRVVSVSAVERFGNRLKAGHVVTIPHSRHEILMETDAIRQQFWAAFDAFIPGTRDELSALVTAQTAIEDVRGPVAAAQY
ncbi:alpha/beta hydrolase [Methylocella sp. CPCC 101449]|uniref:alpha/beta hydrolase n=1 Tax=Methylocella sp. CPCC 101449 TaxID=2987531 RepID=UPI00288D0152|nr:alpha/beta hydrolase [Methylocella sp. CPCC 101449]MDT2023630.1 alpha/beta hydrolase [Methylocella sp. CPCC 101449]